MTIRMIAPLKNHEERTVTPATNKFLLNLNYWFILRIAENRSIFLSLNIRYIRVTSDAQQREKLINEWKISVKL